MESRDYTMFELEGQYAKAKVFTDTLESSAISQIINLLNQESTKGSNVRIMPDAHYGAGSTIGTTMTVSDKIIPNIVGVDIGCGLSVNILKLNPNTINFDELDNTIRKYVPSGYSVQPKNRLHPLSKRLPFRDVKAPFSLKRAKESIGTLGGGNHFIEVNKVDDEHVALVIHSGSRNFGKTIADYYQDKAYDELMDNKLEQQAIIDQLKAQGRHKEIEAELNKLPKKAVQKDLAYVTGKSLEDYVHDMAIAQQYAELNRQAMLDIITSHMKWNAIDSFSTVHNYLDIENMIIRKGAISAQKDERVIIPLNMRDGSIIAHGKGNPDWNYSAPHGAGRLMSRSKAKEEVELDEFIESMTDVWSTSVKESTLDESPMAYKPIEEILDHVNDTITIDQIIKPLYNFKAN